MQERESIEKRASDSPCPSADENYIPLPGRLALFGGHSPLTRPVEQLLEKLLFGGSRRTRGKTFVFTAHSKGMNQ